MAPLSPAQRRIIDEWGELQRRIALVDPDVARAKEIGQLINIWLIEEDAGACIALPGDAYTITASARRLERKVTNKKALFRALGQPRYISLSTVSLSLLDKILSPEEMSLFVTEARIGARRLDATANHRAAVIEMPRPSSRRKAA
jgi:hypothetical protein